jgi:hypothetical protein
MQEAGLPKIMAPDMTISQRIPRPSPKIIDPAELPKWATKTTTTTKPDLAAIKQAFEEDPAGFSCAGVIIPNVEPVLTVRSK